MKILICNDDGIHAGGIRALCNALVDQHEIYVVAPDKERSAMGHALTLHRPLRIEKMPFDFLPKAKAIFAVDGTPADCVKIALNKLLHFKIDWVISGINHGPNMGPDVLYSGTVSAAMEGAIYGIKSMAFSVSEYQTEGFDEQVSFIPKILNKLEKADFQWPDKTIFNVNLPILPKEKIKGIAMTNLGSRMYQDVYEERRDPRGRFYYWLAGDLQKSDPDPNSDVSKVAKGYISITPITFEMTNYKLIDQVKNTFDKFL